MKSGADRMVSVVMPVRNALPYLDDSISSILNQSHRDLELVIGDDGSTDGSSERLASWARRDSRIRLFTGTQAELGPAGSSNWVVRLARHSIIARMDADDISRPRRIEAQLAALRDNPSAVLVGTLFDRIDVRGRTICPRDRSPLAALGASAVPFAHGSIMFRRDAFERAGGYRAACDFWEDQELYWRMASAGRVLVLPEAHYAYRHNPGQSRLKADLRRVERALDLAFRCLAALERGEDYEPLIAAFDPGRDHKIRPEVFRAIGSIQLWSGRRPVILRRLVRKAELGFNKRSLLAFAWCLACKLAPATLRLALKARAHARASLQGRDWPDGRTYEWQPHRDGGHKTEQDLRPLRAA